MGKLAESSGNKLYNDFLNIKGLIIVECSSGSSGSAIIMQPVFARLEAKYRGRVQHYRINTDLYPEIISDYYLMNIPAFLIFFDGELIERIEGMIPAFELEEVVNGIWEKKGL